MKILGIDPGFGRVGVAVIEGKKGITTLIYSTCIQTDPKTSFPLRLDYLCSEIKVIIKEWQPEQLAIEKLFFTSNQKTAMQVSEARGAIISTCTGLGLSVHEYTPLQIKVATTGYGRATKAQIADMIGRLIKLDSKPKHDDEYDAIATGLTHLVSK